MKYKRGFTLIELLIVIAILAGLSTLFMSSFPASQKRGRDTQRKSDIKQYQTQMELYANKIGGYVNTSGTVNVTTQCVTLGLTATCPDDPKNPSQNYKLNSSVSSYVLWTTLEQPLDSTKPYFVVCSDGRSGENATATGPACPIP